MPCRLHGVTVFFDFLVTLCYTAGLSREVLRSPFFDFLRPPAHVTLHLFIKHRTVNVRYVRYSTFNTPKRLVPRAQNTALCYRPLATTFCGIKMALWLPKLNSPCSLDSSFPTSSLSKLCCDLRCEMTLMRDPLKLPPDQSADSTERTRARGIVLHHLTPYKNL